jgi:hypothetical protein
MRPIFRFPARLVLFVILGWTAAWAARPAAPAQAEPVHSGRLEIFSHTGNCTVIVDGGQKVTLSLPNADGSAQGIVSSLAPGRHHILVKSFFTWHDGYVDVGSGELLEIHVEPHSFGVTSRKNGC